MSCTLAQLAADRLFEEEFLRKRDVRDEPYRGKPSVAFSYKSPDGALVATRYRISLNGGDPFRWPSGTRAKGLLYGVEQWEKAKAAGFVFLGEGETDVLAAALHGYPMYGLPGASMWDDERCPPCFDGIDIVYLWREPDKAGEKLVETITRSPIADRVRVISIDGIKDLNELHVAVDGDDRLFQEALEEAMEAAEPLQQPWLESAEDLLNEPEPEMEWLVEDVIGDGEIGAIGGSWKVGKTWLVLELAISTVTGLPALGRFAVPKPGPVMIILEESGRKALRRRLGMLARGRGIRPEQLRHLHFAANKRVRFDETEWKARVMAKAKEIRPRAIFLDPLVRLKGASVDENSQREMAVILDYFRDLRDASSAAVMFVHHEGYGDKGHMRGTSDVEGYWESRLGLKRDGRIITLKPEHREAEDTPAFEYVLDFDRATRSMRLREPERLVYHERDPVGRIETLLRSQPGQTVPEIARTLELKDELVHRLDFRW